MPQGPDRQEMLRNAPLLEPLHAGELAELAGLMRTVQLAAEETFAVRGQPCPGMVLVEAGALEVLLDSTPICSLSPGSVFGEHALVSDAPAAATLRAAVRSVIGVLDREAVEERIDRLPALWALLDRAWRRRILAGRLYTIDLFQDLSAEARMALAAAFEEIDLPPGAVLAREGAQLDCFWVIREGQAELLLPEGADAIALRPGEYVGDLALVEDFPQTATVCAPLGLRAMRLSRTALRAALDAPALAGIEAAALRRKESIL